MEPLALNSVEEITRAIEDMEFVLKQLKADLALIKQLSSRREARDLSGIPHRRRRGQPASITHAIRN